MSNFNRIRLLEAYIKGPSELRETLAQLPVELLGFKPSPTSWSVKEILMHLGDSEVQSHVRCRSIIAEPGSTLMNYDEYQWSQSLGYAEQDHSLSLSIVSLLRKSNYGLLTLLDPSVWAYTCVHSVRGPLSLDDWLETYTRHLQLHIAQMQRNHQVWLQSLGVEVPLPSNEALQESTPRILTLTPRNGRPKGEAP